MKLYRFERATDPRLTTLEEGHLWCSSPEKFNDVSDCRLNMMIGPENQLIPHSVLTAIDAGQFDSPLGNDVVSTVLSILKNKGNAGELLTDVTIAYDESSIREHIVKTTGVCCFFASDPVDALMWAHYGDNHEGFCVEYEVDDGDEKMKQNMFEVNYMSKLPEVSPEELLFSPHLAMKRIVTSKSFVWSHEKEYRYVLTNALGGTEEGVGKRIPLPDWLRPTKVICGLRQSGDEINWKMETLAVRLDVSRDRVEMFGGKLQLINVQNRRHD